MTVFAGVRVIVLVVVVVVVLMVGVVVVVVPLLVVVVVIVRTTRTHVRPFLCRRPAVRRKPLNTEAVVSMSHMSLATWSLQSSSHES